MLVSAVVPILVEAVAATAELDQPTSWHVCDKLLLIRNLNRRPWRVRAKVLRTANLDWNADLWLNCEATK